MASSKQWTYIARNRQLKGRAAVSIGELVEEFRKGPMLRQVGQRAALEEAVAQVLGERLAAHVRPGGVRWGKLVLFVDGPAYRYELQSYRYDELLEAVQRGAPGLGVYELQFKLDGKVDVGRDRRQA